MKDGSYGRKQDFAAFKVAKFVPHLFHPPFCKLGCGASTISLLTGKFPDDIPTRSDWPVRCMTSFLRKNGFDLMRLTKRQVTNCEGPTYPITKSHVVLSLIKMLKGESSWIVLHNGMVFHNFEFSFFDPYEMFNHPVVDAYLLKHKSWGFPKVDEYYHTTSIPLRYRLLLAQAQSQ
jgi:hypothetical protein